jgi:hypothetical protein
MVSQVYNYLHNYGWGPSGGVGLILLIIIIVLIVRGG